MNEPTTQQNLTPELVKHKLGIELSKVEMSIQALADLTNNLVINEDTIQETSDVIAKLKKARKIVDDERAKAKEPSLQEGRTIDAGAKILLTEIDGFINSVSTKYTKLCAEIQERNRKIAQAEAESKRLKELVNNTIMNYSERIGNATTFEAIADIERLVNLETANKAKYGDELENLKERLIPIRGLISAQKTHLKQMAENQRQKGLVEQSGNDEQLAAILDKEQELEQSISNTSIKIQEEAAKQAQTSTVSKVEQIQVAVKHKRKTDEFEVIDYDTAFKKHKELFTINPIKDEIKALGKKLRATGEWKEGTDYLYQGIKFYEKKIY